MSKLKVILGGGESGVGAAVLAKQQGFDVFVSDKGKMKNQFIEKLQQEQIPFEQEKHSLEKILQAEEIIKSPGIPNTAEVVVKAKQRNIPVIGELEFGWRYCKGKVIGITGSNGKSTTTWLTGHVLKNGGIYSVMAGNIGNSFALTVAQEKPYDWYVLEVSNFQLDDAITFKPNIAILLNITPDHLDRYNYRFEDYINSKFRITANQDAND